ncbi:MAG: hypothetical protein AB1607_18265 [Chloroflexota bacterium]
MTISAFLSSTDTMMPSSKSIAVFIEGLLLEGHNKNLPERMDSSLTLEAICGGGICSQKSAESSVLNTCNPGNENKSFGVMFEDFVKVGVAVIKTVADGLGLLVTVGNWDWTEVEVGLEAKDISPAQLYVVRTFGTDGAIC